MKNLRNSVWLIGGELASRLVSFFVIVQLANYLGSAQYGQLSLAFAVANILVVIADFGLSTYLIKVIARQPNEASRLFGEILAVKLFLIAVTLLLLIATSAFVTTVPASVFMLGAIAIITANLRMFIEACYRASEKMWLEAVSKISAALLLAGGLLLAMLASWNIIMITWLYAVLGVVSVVVALVLLHIKITTLSLGGSWTRWKVILLGAWPFALSIACNYLFNYEDAALLGSVFGQVTAVGWYTAAYKPVFFFTAVAGMIINAYFPAITKAYQQHPEKLTKIVPELFVTNLSIALPLAIGGTIVAPQLMAWLYKPEFAPATLAFQILIWGTVCIYVWAVFGNTLQACDQQASYTKIFLVGALTNTVLNLLLIGPFSLYGAAAATVLTQLLLCALMYQSFRKHLAINVWPQAWRPLVAAVVMGAVVYVMPLELFNRILVGAVVYAVALFLVRGWPQQLWRA